MDLVQPLGKVLYDYRCSINRFFLYGGISENWNIPRILCHDSDLFVLCDVPFYGRRRGRFFLLFSAAFVGGAGAVTFLVFGLISGLVSSSAGLSAVHH